MDIITLDGPTSSGKNSVGFLLARRLGYKYIDSGMIYRAGCVKVFEENIAPDDVVKVLDVYKDLNISFETVKGEWKVFLDGSDVTDKLHIPEISNLVHIIAAIPDVREIVKGIQKRVAGNGKTIVGGRDIGSEIFPDAKYKFFLTASVQVRAQRRYKQLLIEDSAIKYDDVLKDLEERDEHDATREASPMRVPKDAIVIDNSDMTIEQTVDKMLEYIK